MYAWGFGVCMRQALAYVCVRLQCMYAWGFGVCMRGALVYVCVGLLCVYVWVYVWDSLRLCVRLWCMYAWGFSVCMRGALVYVCVKLWHMYAWGIGVCMHGCMCETFCVCARGFGACVRVRPWRCHVFAWGFDVCLREDVAHVWNCSACLPEASARYIVHVCVVRTAYAIYITSVPMIMPVLRMHVSAVWRMLLSLFRMYVWIFVTCMFVCVACATLHARVSHWCLQSAVFGVCILEPFAYVCLDYLME